MCGRAVVIDEYGFEHVNFGIPVTRRPGCIFRRTFNLAPTDPIPIVRLTGAGQGEIGEVRWGLVPHDCDVPPRTTFNARSDSLYKRTWAGPFRSQRCVVLVDGFYEWPAKPNADRRPRWIRRHDGRPLALAGLWASHATVGESAAIITTAANSVLRTVPHERMPVVLDDADVSSWLAPDSAARDLLALLRPCEADVLVLSIASMGVNRRVDDPTCLAPDADPDADPEADPDADPDADP